jgi:predicted small metal-binding protein
MAKTVYCRNLGFDCEGVVQAETEGEVLQQVADHAREAHNMETIPDEVIIKVREVMREVD